MLASCCNLSSLRKMGEMASNFTDKTNDNHNGKRCHPIIGESRVVISFPSTLKNLEFNHVACPKTEKKRYFTHYSSSQRILLVGEGDFSFSACLARAFGSAKNMVATSLDSQGTLINYFQMISFYLSIL